MQHQSTPTAQMIFEISPTFLAFQVTEAFQGSPQLSVASFPSRISHSFVSWSVKRPLKRLLKLILMMPLRLILMLFLTISCFF